MKKVKFSLKNVVVCSTLLLLSLVMSCSKKDDAAPVVNGVDLRVDPNFGEILTDNLGNTLYFFSNDFGTTSQCAGGCTTAWPVFYVEDIKLNGLAPALFGEITRADGKKQITYKGWPLYYFANDHKAGDVTGDKVDDVWYVAKPEYSVMLAKANGLKYLVNEYGSTLYTFGDDTDGVSNCNGNCIVTWPEFVNPYANVSVPSLLNEEDFDLITRTDGVTPQTTYKGKPLYNYSNDVVKGDTLGQGLAGGKWSKLKETRF